MHAVGRRAEATEAAGRVLRSLVLPAGRVV